VTLGIRHSDVRFVSDDHYVTAQNPDDSGRRAFSRASPVAGVVWHAGPDLNVYASYGEGFETPTFAEMAYRAGGTGLNFALNPATSKAAEIGVKAIVARRHRINIAAFAVDTNDEIVTDTASGGRTTFKNASSTRRRGIEGAWDAQWSYGLSSRLAYTWLRATFDESFRTGAEIVPGGARLPGVPATYGYAELAWTAPLPFAPQVAIEVIRVDRIFVNDRNTDAAPRYTVANVRFGLEQRWTRITLKEYVRLNNAFDRRYAGSVIVGDTNGRFFEPAPGRNWMAGLTAEVRF
jgi:iron complex outermembrane receptor protein